METEKLAVVGLVILIVGAISIYLIANEGFFQTETETEMGIEKGDAVQVTYTGKFQVNGTVFDTSLEEVAKEAGIYDELRPYEPLKIFVNPDGDLTPPEDYSEYTSAMIPGFINGLIGMKEGETKSVVIQPEDAYGDWNETLAEQSQMDSFALDTGVEKTVTQNKTQFLTGFVDISETDLVEGFTFDYGEALFIDSGIINATIDNVTDVNVTYTLNIENQTTTFFSYFNCNIMFTTGNDTHYNMRLLMDEGHTFSIDYYGMYIHFKVIEVNDTHAKSTMNFGAPELQYVGQILVFEITIEKVYKTSNQEES